MRSSRRMYHVMVSQLRSSILAAVLLAMPSPYFKAHMVKITEPLADKIVISAIKGIVPEDNLTVADYMVRRYGVSPGSISRTALLTIIAVKLSPFFMPWMIPATMA